MGRSEPCACLCPEQCYSFHQTLGEIPNHIDLEVVHPSTKDNAPGCLQAAHTPLSLLGQAWEGSSQCLGWLKGQVGSGNCLSMLTGGMPEGRNPVGQVERPRLCVEAQALLPPTRVLPSIPVCSGAPAGGAPVPFIPHLCSFGPTVSWAVPSLHSPPELRVGSGCLGTAVPRVQRRAFACCTCCCFLMQSRLHSKRMTDFPILNH